MGNYVAFRYHMSYLIGMYWSFSSRVASFLAFAVALAALGFTAGRLDGEAAADAAPSDGSDDLGKSTLSVESPIETRPYFTTGVVRVEFRNGEAHPAEVLFRLVVDESLTAKPSEKRVNLAAGEAAKVEFKLVSLRARPPLEVPLSTLEYSITYMQPDGEKTIEGSREVVVGNLWIVNKASRAITIDGGFKDWGWLPREFNEPTEFQPSARAGQWRNRLDGSAKYQALHHAKTLYLALEVWDDSVRIRKDHDARKNDGILIWGDVAPGGTGSGEPWFVINPGLRETNTDVVPIAGAPKGVLAAATLTNIGYNVELALPIDYFETLVSERTKRGKRMYLRLNFAINDIDLGDEAPVSLLWQPGFLGERDHGWTGLIGLGGSTKEEVDQMRLLEMESAPGAKNKKKRRN